MKKKDCEGCGLYETWGYECCECFEKQLDSALRVTGEQKTQMKCAEMVIRIFRGHYAKALAELDGALALVELYENRLSTVNNDYGDEEQ